MAHRSRNAYSVLLSASLLVAAGCGSEPPQPPPGAPKEATTGFQPPKVDIDPPGGAADGASKDKTPPPPGTPMKEPSPTAPGK
ncbi:MAG: hypothetical protein K8T25_12345 [Planctomycetia bacterium]|nr:hypothetical protein [Planctomycetia bacterium]